MKENKDTEENKNNLRCSLSVFNYKKFFLSNEGWGNDNELRYPPLLSFPTFFYCSMAAILGEITNSYIQIPFKTSTSLPIHLTHYVCLMRNVEDFLNLLQYIFKLIINDKNFNFNFKDPKIVMHKLMEMVKKHEFDEKCLYLEWYLEENDDSIKNYQTALKDVNLSYNGVESIPALFKYLKEEKVIMDKTDTITKDYYQNLDEINNLLASPYYVLTSRIPYTTNIWGPIYWHIFHTLPKNAHENVYEFPNSIILNTLHSFMLFLSILVPCSICRYHYINSIRPSHINPLSTISAYKNLYFKIHDIVNEHKYAVLS